MSKPKYKLKDMYNGDIIGYFDSMAKLRKAYRQYDKSCEGDWMPEIRVLNPETEKYQPLFSNKF